MSVLPTHDGCTLFVSVSAHGPVLSNGKRRQNGIQKLIFKHGRFATSGFLPLADEPAGMALSNDGRHLFVADNMAGIAELDTGSPQGLTLTRYILKNLHGGFFQIALAKRGDVLYAGAMKKDRVIAVPLADPNKFKDAATDHFPVGLALSRDGQHLFVTNAVAVDPQNPKFHPVKCAYTGDPGKLHVVQNEGTLEVFNTARLAAGQTALEARVRAACAPVRVVFDDRRSVVWITARESDVLLAYRLDEVLAQNRAHVLRISTGRSPVGLAINAFSDEIAVGNSARFQSHAGRQSVKLYPLGDLRRGVVATSAARQVGVFPRDIAASRTQRIFFVANFGSASVSIIASRNT